MRLIVAPLLSVCLLGTGVAADAPAPPASASQAALGGRNRQDADSFVRDLKLGQEPSKTAEKLA